MANRRKRFLLTTSVASLTICMLNVQHLHAIESRKWVSADGKHETVAEFVSFDGTDLRLRRGDKEFSVKVSQLDRASRQLAHRLASEAERQQDANSKKFSGRTAREWAELLRTSKDEEDLHPIVRLDWKAFGTSGERAVPILMEIVTRGYGRSGQERRVSLALAALSTMGPDAESASDELAQLLLQKASKIQQNMGDHTLNQEEEVLECLATMGCTQDDCMKIAKRYVAVPPQRQYRAVLQVLSSSGSRGVPALEFMLKQRSASPQNGGVTDILDEIYSLGPIAGPLALPIVKLLDDNMPDSARYAETVRRLLISMGPSAVQAGPWLSNRLQDGDMTALEVLAKMGPCAREHLEPFAHLMDDARLDTRAEAIEAFTRVAPDLVPADKRLSKVSLGSRGYQGTSIDGRLLYELSEPQLQELIWLEAFQVLSRNIQNNTTLDIRCPQTRSGPTGRARDVPLSEKKEIAKILNNGPWKLGQVSCDSRFTRSDAAFLANLNHTCELVLTGNYDDPRSFLLLGEAASVSSIVLRGEIKGEPLLILAKLPNIATVKFERPMSTPSTNDDIARLQAANPNVEVWLNGKIVPSRTEFDSEKSLGASNDLLKNRQRRRQPSKLRKQHEFSVGQTTPVFGSVRISPMNTLVAFAGSKELNVCDLKSGRIVQTIQHEGPWDVQGNHDARFMIVQDVQFSPNEEWMLVQGFRDSALWNRKENQWLAIPGDQHPRSMAFSPDSRSLAIGSDSRKSEEAYEAVTVHELPSLQLRGKLEGLKLGCHWLSFTRNGRELLASVEGNATLNGLVALDSSTLVARPFEGSKTAITKVLSQEVYIDSRRLEQIQLPPRTDAETEANVYRAVVGASNAVVWAIEKSGEVREDALFFFDHYGEDYWKRNPRQGLREIPRNRDALPPAGMSSRDFQQALKEKNHYQRIHDGLTSAVDCAKHGGFVVTGDKKGNLAVWNPRNGKIYCRIDQAHQAPIDRILLSDDDAMVITHSADGQLVAWKVE